MNKTNKICTEITINNCNYQVFITYKKIKRIILKYRDNCFHISSPKRVKEKYLIELLIKNAPKLLKKNKESPYIQNEYIYIFGEKINTHSDEFNFDFLNEDKLKKELAHILYLYINERIISIYNEMKIIEPYKIRVKDIKYAYGSNSRKTHSLTFSTSLVHYAKDTIDSIIYHELCHDKFFNHGKEFYNILYYYCPNYKKLIKKLKKGVFQ